MSGPATPVVLTIAGSDSGGGAGVQADLKTFEAHGVFGTTAITAVTAQNTTGVQRVLTLPPDLVSAQIVSVVSDLRPAAVKTGMLADRVVIEAVTTEVSRWKLGPLVVDPVMVATSGDPLLEADAVEAMIAALLPLATVVTPNSMEAEVLTGRSVEGPADQARAAREIVALGAGAALVKGGHIDGDPVVDVLWDGETETVFESGRITTTHTHGTGCTLSAALAAELALGRELTAAVDAALAFTRRAIESAPGLGSGSGPLGQAAAAGPRD